MAWPVCSGMEEEEGRESDGRATWALEALCASEEKGKYSDSNGEAGLSSLLSLAPLMSDVTAC